MTGRRRHQESSELLRQYRPYPAYKDSGVEWLGEIPAHWEVKKWRYCCHVTEGQVAADDDRFRERILIAPNHIESGTGRIDYTETADEQGAISGKYLVTPGDIIYSKIRPALNKVCIAAGDWLCSADMYPVAITEKRLQPRFLLYFMLSEPFVRLMVDESMRVAMPKVNREKLATCPLIIADPEEQHTIVAFLDRETARIDALVVKKQRLIALLQEKRSALITQAVTKGLDPTVTMKDSGVEWLGQVPAHWKLVPSTWLFTESKQRAHDGDQQLSATQRYGVIPQAEFERLEGRQVVHVSMHLDQRKHVEVNDFVMSMRSFEGGLERVRARGCVRSSYVALRSSGEVHDGLFSYLFKSSAYVQALRATSNFIRDGQDLNFENFRLVRLPLVPLREQETIAAFLDRETTRLDALVARLRDAIERLKELRTALISAAVTGKIDVRECAS